MSRSAPTCVCSAVGPPLPSPSATTCSKCSAHVYVCVCVCVARRLLVGGGRNQTYSRPESFDIDYGTPTGLCGEAKGTPGVFVREWTKATVQHDCNTGESSITMK